MSDNTFTDLKTKNGYLLSDVRSAAHKELRRGDAKMAGFWCLELSKSGYTKYVWNLLLVVTAEDCWGLLTAEIESLCRVYQRANEKKKRDELTGHIFVSKAVCLICIAKKSRDADHLTAIVHNRKLDVTEEELAASLEQNWEECELPPIPEYAYDAHTVTGKRRGKTKEQFFVDEQAALNPHQPGLFDNLPDVLAATRAVRREKIVPRGLRGKGGIPPQGLHE